MESDPGNILSVLANLPPKEDFINLAQYLRTLYNPGIQPSTTHTIYTSNQIYHFTGPKLTFSLARHIHPR